MISASKAAAKATAKAVLPDAVGPTTVINPTCPFEGFVRKLRPDMGGSSFLLIGLFLFIKIDIQ
jgi:hypothetical protein